MMREIVAQGARNANRVNSLGGLLLCHAVDGAKAEDEIAASNADDGAIGKESGERVECFAIVGIVERGNEYKFVGNVEVRIAGGKPLAVEIDRRRHGQSLDAERVAVLIFHGFEKSEVFLKSGVVGI